MKLENSNFFRLRHSFHGLTNTFEIQEFRPKIEIFHKHSKICPMSIMRSLHHTMKLENSIFFRLRHSFHGLTPLKFKNFNQKLKYSISTQKFAQKSLMRSLHHTMKLENSIFFRLRHSFDGLTPLKLKIFDQKLK